MLLPLYLLALTALLVGASSLYMPMIKAFPVTWIYYLSFVSRPIVWAILVGSGASTLWLTKLSEVPPYSAIGPLLLMGLAVILSYKMRQENAFVAVDFPPVTKDVMALPLTDEMLLAVVEYEGQSRAYPLDYVVHHHIINDHFGERVVSLTYCAMCRSIIPFDVTDIGPLFVASFKNANMIVGDRKTRTWFQQASFESIIGKLHPHTLTMIPFQILSWGDLKTLSPMPQIVEITQNDLREFELPIPGVWKKLMASEATPGVRARDRDKSFSARTHVIGISPIGINPKDPQSDVVYLKEELMSHGITHNPALELFLVATNNSVNAFSDSMSDAPLKLVLTPENTLSDSLTGTTWDLRGKRIEGELKQDLEPVAISDEYWFSWRLFHPRSELIRL
ncbi:DUF3179 domain-containing protein [Myxococcota bacterium]|nr:DUF3179 domain-containing protein [Myxococcota bacterium]